MLRGCLCTFPTLATSKLACSSTKTTFLVSFLSVSSSACAEGGSRPPGIQSMSQISLLEGPRSQGRPANYGQYFLLGSATPRQLMYADRYERGQLRCTWMAFVGTPSDVVLCHGLVPSVQGQIDLNPISPPGGFRATSLRANFSKTSLGEGLLQKVSAMAQRLTYRRRHCYATQSNKTRKVKTPGTASTAASS